MTRVIVTRPEREAQRWVRDLAALGFDAQALPLIEIASSAEPAELTRAWQQLDGYLALMFALYHRHSYTGCKPAMTDVLAGRVPIMFAPISTALPHIRSGKLIALAVTYPQRLDDLPNTPTLAEAGIKNFDMSIWFGLVAPKGTPPDRIAKLGAVMQKTLVRDDVRKALAIQGIVPAIGQGPAAFTRRMEVDIEKLRAVFAATGMKMSE